MSFYHSPYIATKGLVFYLDATNFKSYPGSGDTWYGLVQNRNATLINSPTFNKTNYGEFIFDGSTRYIQSSRYIEINYSSSIWFKLNSTVGNQMLYGQSSNGFGYVDAFVHDGRLSHQRFNGGVWYDKIGTTTALIEADKVYNAVFTVEGDSSINVYLNGRNVNGLNPGILSVTTLGGLNLFTRQRAGEELYTAGSIYAFSVYNRMITPEEVLQNYKALQGRYG